jgi:hypothetical protein
MDSKEIKVEANDIVAGPVAVFNADSLGQLALTNHTPANPYDIIYSYIDPSAGGNSSQAIVSIAYTADVLTVSENNTYAYEERRE